MKREYIDFVIDGYAMQVLHHTRGDRSRDSLRVGDITLGTLRQMRSDVTSFVRQTGSVLDGLVEVWIQDSAGLNEMSAMGYLIRKLNMLGERFFATRTYMYPSTTWRWFKPPEWGDARMAKMLHDVAQSFPKVTFHVDQSGRVKQQ